MPTINHVKNGSVLYDVCDSRLGDLSLFSPANAGKFIEIGVDGNMTLSSFNGTVDYEQLRNLPTINGTTIMGNVIIPTYSNEAILRATTAPYTVEERTKLANITAEANKYILPYATASDLGGVKIDNTTICRSGTTDQIYVDFTSVNDRIQAILDKADIQNEISPITPEDTLSTKQYVIDAVSTSSAHFRGTFEGEYDEDFAYVNPDVIICDSPQNNDYAFIHIVNPDNNQSEYLRFKYIENLNTQEIDGEWVYEYALSTTFDTTQWAAINSHINQALRDYLADLEATSAGSAVLPVYFSNGQFAECNDTLDVNITGNAATASTWAETCNLSISARAGTTGTVLDGSEDITLIIPQTLNNFTSITSTTFVGALNGNANTATNADKIDNYHFDIVEYKNAYTNTQPTADTEWYLKISTPNWNATPETILIKTTGANMYGVVILKTGSRQLRWAGFATSYNFIGVTGVAKVISQSDDIYIKLDPACTSVDIKTTFAATITSDTHSGIYTTVPTSGGFFANAITANIDGNATTATSAIQDGNGAIISSTYLPLIGGTLTGPLYIKSSTAATTNSLSLLGNSNGGNITLFAADTSDDMFKFDRGEIGKLRLMGSDDGGTTAAATYTWDKLGNFTATKVYGAVWNDYAEYRQADSQEPGRCVVETGDDTLQLSTKRLQGGAEIISDTFGFAIGATEYCQTPIATSGRVLAYPYEDIKEFKKNIGKPVCSGPDGTVSIMTDEEYEKYGYCAIGTISSIPNYERWGSGGIDVNGRVWIRIR